MIPLLRTQGIEFNPEKGRDHHRKWFLGKSNVADLVNDNSTKMLQVQNDPKTDVLKTRDVVNVAPQRRGFNACNSNDLRGSATLATLEPLSYIVGEEKGTSQTTNPAAQMPPKHDDVPKISTVNVANVANVAGPLQDNDLGARRCPATLPATLEFDLAVAPKVEGKVQVPARRCCRRLGRTSSITCCNWRCPFAPKTP